MKPRCVCGCGRRAVQRHHAVYEQHLREPGFVKREGPGHRSLLRDPRNLVWIARECHDAHHSRQHPLGLLALPDSVFEFAQEVLGAGPAYVYLRRRYAGEDERLERIRWAADHPERDADALGAGGG